MLHCSTTTSTIADNESLATNVHFTSISSTFNQFAVIYEMVKYTKTSLSGYIKYPVINCRAVSSG